jgi:hypothetical protein
MRLAPLALLAANSAARLHNIVTLHRRPLAILAAPLAVTV